MSWFLFRTLNQTIVSKFRIAIFYYFSIEIDLFVFFIIFQLRLMILNLYFFWRSLGWALVVRLRGIVSATGTQKHRFKSHQSVRFYRTLCIAKLFLICNTICFIYFSLGEIYTCMYIKKHWKDHLVQSIFSIHTCWWCYFLRAGALGKPLSF
jgi:hypothetical protein